MCAKIDVYNQQVVNQTQPDDSSVSSSEEDGGCLLSTTRKGSPVDEQYILGTVCYLCQGG